MTAVELANLALHKIGVSKTISAITEGSRESLTVTVHYDHVLRYCLTRHPWSFATKYADLELVRGPFWNTDPTELVLVEAWDTEKSYVLGDVVRRSSVNYYALQASTAKDPATETDYWSADQEDAPDYANGDWRYGYRWPSDCLFARRLVNPATGRVFDPDPYVWRKGRDQNGLVIFTSIEDANLEYTTLDCLSLFPDDLFIDFLTSTLAAKLAPTLAQNGTGARDWLAHAELAFSLATVDDARQQQQDKPGEAEWVSGR